MKKVRYLQDKNPDVPGIIYKLEPENEKHRKLQNVRKLWSAIWHISGIKDIYSGTQLGKKEYEIWNVTTWVIFRTKRRIVILYKRTIAD